MYFDPDTKLYSVLDPLIERLAAHSLIFTPHSCTFDDSDSNIAYELAMLSTGVFNLGFLATRRSEEASRFFRWWQKRLFDYCYYKPGTGVFVDQLWAVLAPLYFSSSFIEKNPGYNMAYWNLFERRLTHERGTYFVNRKHPLVLYHFSNYDPLNPGRLSSRRWPAPPTFEDRPEMMELFEEYRTSLLSHGFRDVCDLRCHYGNSKPNNAGPNQPIVAAAKNMVRWGVSLLPSPIKALIGRAGRFAAKACADDGR
jgi:hypothetical protein